jgi:hypothetical protein
MRLGTYGIATVHEGLDQPFLYRLAGEISENIFVWILVSMGLKVFPFRSETFHFDLMVLDPTRTVFKKGIALISVKSRESRGRVQITQEHFEALKKQKISCESLEMGVYICIAFFHPRRVSEITYYLFPLDILEEVRSGRSLSLSKKKADKISNEYSERVISFSDDWAQPRCLNSKLHKGAKP